MRDKLRQSMTYGVMPTFEDFERAFNEECPRGRYSIVLGSSDNRAADGFRLGDGEWTATDLYSACVEIADVWHAERCTDETVTDVALGLVCSILDTLGFEWI